MIHACLRREKEGCMRVFLRGIAALICMGVFLVGSTHVCFADNMTETEMFFSNAEAYSGLIDVPGRGLMRYYAQNDPLWADLVYEKGDVSTHRPFRDSACGPTAGAMAVASLVPEDELDKIADYALRPYSLCPCSLNKAKCEGHHARYVLTSKRDFVRFLPLVFGDFATGNNTFGVFSRGITLGTNSSFLYQIAQVYGLTLTATADYRQALKALKNGDAVIATAGRGGAFTNTGHYVFLASVDEEKLYILDPLCRDAYSTRQGRKVEIIHPGLVALTHQNVSAAALGGFLIFHKAEGR